MRQPADFSVDPDELVAAAEQANTVSDGFTHMVWKDERIGDLSEGADPDDERLATALATYRRSLRAATLRLADRAERLGTGLRASADEYASTDQASAGLIPRPDPHDE